MTVALARAAQQSARTEGAIALVFGASITLMMIRTFSHPSNH